MEGADDPLDVYMASIEKDIVLQDSSPNPVAIPRTHAPSVDEARTSEGNILPTYAQDELATKVARSPLYDILWRRKARRPRFGSQCTEVGEDDAAREKKDTCLRLLMTQTGEFLRCFGHVLSNADLDSFIPSHDPDVVHHVEKLKTLKLQSESVELTETDVDMSCAESQQTIASPISPLARNRRYRRLQQLAKGGVWFSDEAMRERDPWLWHDLVGRKEGEERPAPHGAPDKIPGSTTYGTYLQESLEFLSRSTVDRSGTAGKGPSLGTAFLSGACLDFSKGSGREDIKSQGSESDGTSDAEPAEVLQGRDVDLSGIRTISPGPTSHTRPATESMSAAIEGHNLDDSRRVRFVVPSDVRGGGVECRTTGERNDAGHSDSEGGYDDDEDQEVEEATRRSGEGRIEMERILSERFMDGDEEGVDYAAVDADERLDDLDELARDEQERWFRSQEEDGAVVDMEI